MLFGRMLLYLVAGNYNNYNTISVYWTVFIGPCDTPPTKPCWSRW